MPLSLLISCKNVEKKFSNIICEHMQVMISCPPMFPQLASLVTLSMAIENTIVTFSSPQPDLHKCPQDQRHVKLGVMLYW